MAKTLVDGDLKEGLFVGGNRNSFPRRDCCVLQFAKLPELGKVKTRMQPHLSPAQSVLLHQRLTTHTYACLAPEPGWDYQLWASSEPDADFFTRLVEPAQGRVKVLAQRGADLGERMGAAQQLALASYRWVVIVGSDCPFLTPAHIQRMFAALQQGSDCVLVPAEDGGYVAIGAGRYAPDLFAGVSWGGATVLAQTLANLARLGWRHSCLEALPDIDRPEDLQQLQELGWWSAERGFTP